MRKITEQAVKALANGVKFSSGNTVVSDGKLFLHGNNIVSTSTYGNVVVPSTESGVFVPGSGIISNFGSWANIIGSTALVAANVQATLDTAFPAASTGDGVIDTTTSHIWVLGPTLWIDTNATDSDRYLVFPKKNILE